MTFKADSAGDFPAECNKSIVVGDIGRVFIAAFFSVGTETPQFVVGTATLIDELMVPRVFSYLF